MAWCLPRLLGVFICIIVVLPLHASACTCNAGEYVHPVNNCTTCPPGRYCSSCDINLCPAGTERTTSGATVLSDCTSCPPGYYALSSGTESCTACPAGHYCASPDAAPIPCSQGNYASTPAQSSCDVCPVGTYSHTSGRSSCLDCPSGTYTSGNSSSLCTTCEPGNECPTTSISSPCAAGTYSVGGQSVCSPCQLGTYSEGGAASCPMCPPGMACVNPALPPSPCPDGWFSTGGISSNCTQCPTGTAPSADKSYCVSCSAGYQCPNSIEEPCPAGTWSYQGITTSCTACPAGFYCPFGGPSPPDACLPGTYSLGSVSNCTDCPAGFSCLNPADPPAACATGFYSILGDHKCIPCPAGYKCPYSNGTIACPEGTYSVSESITCDDCPDGFACPDPALLPAACPDGYSSPLGQHNCTGCPAGFDCSSAASPVPCPTGEYSVEGNVYCTSCPAGFACPDPTSLPQVCQSGTFSVGGQSTCTGCPAGNRCPYVDQAVLFACQPGTYSTGNMSYCVACPAGFACPNVLTASMTACPTGQYSPGSMAACLDCPAGSECPQTDGSQNVVCQDGSYSIANQTSCTLCPAGFECPSKFSDQTIRCSPGSYSVEGQADCTPCPRGMYCPDDTLAPTTFCEIGEFSLGSATACTPCPAGFSCSNTETSARTSCALGTYSFEGSSVCTPCPAGSFCSNTTSVRLCDPGYYSLQGASQCTICPAGYDCFDVNRQNPVPCSAGTYSGQGFDGCLSCYEGYDCPAGATSPNSADYLCEIGYYCNSVGRFPCPQGTYGIIAGASNITSGCASCPPGYFCSETPTVLYQSSICPEGYFCPEGTRISTDYPCPAGTFNPLQGSVGNSSCQTCPAGRYCPQASANSDTLCPSGYYCPSGSGAYCAPGASGCDSNPPQPCPAGTYSGDRTGLTTAFDCLNCTAGHYCPEGSTSPTACSSGTFTSSLGGTSPGNCQACLAGMACPSSGLPYPTSNCTAGHYCPSGTIFASDNPCAPGTYTNSFGLTSASDCDICPAGFACGFGTGGAQKKMEDCAVGHYCPMGTTSPTEYPCPAGYYGTATNAESASECIICPAGSYCLGGESSPTGTCAEGHYCPAGSSNAAAMACPGGTYSASTNLTNSDQCSVCPEGYYCPSGSAVPIGCPAGTYSDRKYADSTGLGSWPSCTECPAGYKCPTIAMTAPLECGVGTYSAAGVLDCTTCDAGFYCDSATTSTAQRLSNPCPAGTLCPPGMSVEPDLQSYACPPGSYCPAAQYPETPCDAGSYNPFTGAQSQSDCITCQPGHYCLVGSINITGECAAGYWCEAGSQNATANACPLRTYREFSAGETSGACAECPAGYYCPSTATVMPSTCPQGYFCRTGVSNPSSCPKGTYGNSTQLRSSDDCTSCDPGTYCDGIGLTQPTGLCDPGYYCILGARTATAVNQSDAGGLCPAGGYCPAGSTQALPCQPGTYSNRTGMSDSSDCIACPPGEYCAGSNNAGSSGLCSAGYYCPGGASTPNDQTAGIGTYTKDGASIESPCLPGTYNPATAQSSCFDCPAGFFCSNFSLSSYEVCPVGSYCPTGTAEPKLCPTGTFSTTPGLANVTECEVCTAGQFCSTPGNGLPTGDCSPGYYCVGGAFSSTPTDGITGDICPRGHYCPAASISPQACLVGFFNPLQGQQNVSACLACTPGSYCETTGLAQPTGVCSSGYYCPGGDVAYQPANTICPIGNYCPINSTLPRPCIPGTYMDVVGQSSCLDCPAGQYCPGNSTSIVCPTGSYCPTNSETANNLCPVGTFGNRTGLITISECTPCTAGFYCEAPGLSEPSGPCQAGYFCPEGSTSQLGNPTNCVNSTKCGPGTYCPANASVPLDCPIGTYSNASGNRDLSYCQPCDGGYYCDTPGATAPTGLCDAGYACISGATSATPPTDPLDSIGGICPAGRYCPVGTSQPLPCSPGSYNPHTGQSECQECPGGFYCPENTTSYLNYACPSGHFCPNGTTIFTEHPCPSGTYNNQTQLTSEAECTPCPAGWYCEGTANEHPDGPCQQGYYCPIGTSTPNPAATICSPGNFCPEGAAEQKSCTGGYYCDIAGLPAPTGPCFDGYYCPVGESAPNGWDCPTGHYCPSGTEVPLECPIGTFSPSANNYNITQCAQCTPGRYCDVMGMSSDSQLCPDTFYCPLGTGTPSLQCTAGNECPEGSSTEQPCSPGYYQDNPAQASCSQCPEGFYCQGTGLSSFEPCPRGYYCPVGTISATAYPCINGTFGNTTMMTKLTDCHDCPPGQYCFGSRLTEPTGPCKAGYYCLGGASTPTPTDGVTGDLCTDGNYCPAGSIVPTSCNPGFFANGIGNTNSSSCLACPAGQYCAVSGSATVTYCSPGYVCTGGSTVATPTTGVGYVCPAGTYCVEGALNPQDCNPGTYNPNEGEGECFPCPEGRLCASAGMTNFTDCPKGYYCPSNSSVPTPCPAGSFSQNYNLRTASECTACDKGKYCLGTNLTQPTGDCAQGFYCDYGSNTPNPTGVYPNSGPCPAGNYCPSGTQAPQQCGYGTFYAGTQAETAAQCTPCTAGQYCGALGLTVPTADCDAGYYCPGGSDVPNDVQCPRGYYCPTGSADPIGCPDTTYNNLPGKATCDPCPAGFICESNSTTPAICPLRYYCEEGTQPTLCRNGTYGASEGLERQNDCAECPPGKYCSNGVVTGDCAAGYLCISNNDDPTPDGWDPAIGGLCRAGHYCVAGATNMTVCAAGTVRGEVGGKSQSDCGACPAGYECIGSIPYPCPVGSYCELNDVPEPCPIGTYNSQEYASNISSCLPCEAGYWCKETGMSDYSVFPCPVGSYCEEGVTEPQICGDGTFRNDVGAASSTDCTTCPGGYYCTSGTNYTAPCPPAYYCEPGSGYPSPCVAGNYCPQFADALIICPAGSYCPDNSTDPIECPAGTYCPEGSYTPTLCPLGYTQGDFNIRVSLDTGCKICPDGTYSDDPLRQTCYNCSAGYVCLEGCDSPTPSSIAENNGYPCPVGAYCPEGSSVETLCDAGYYNDITMATSIADCLPCSAGSYANDAGSEKCKPCGSSAFSLDAATTCNCTGANRAYQMYDGSCLCHTGFEYYDESETLYSGDSKYDCQPRVFETCEDGEFRSAHGDCITNGESCATACADAASASTTNPSIASDAGSYDESLGVCVCRTLLLDATCGSNCRSSAPTLALASGASSFQVFDAAANTLSAVSLNDISGYFGSMKCSSTSGCNVVSIVADSKGHTAVYGIATPVAHQLTSLSSFNESTGTYTTLEFDESPDEGVFLMGEDMPAYSTRRSYTMSASDLPTTTRRLLSHDPATYTDSLPGITNPTVCLNEGDGILFDLSDPVHYPVYDVENILNTNDDFDYGAFRELETKILNNATVVSVFGFTFETAGVYVFYDAHIPDKLTFIVVMQPGSSCPTTGGAAIVPSSVSNLVSLGVTQNDSLQFEPDLAVVAILLSIFFVLTCCLVLSAWLRSSRARRAMRAVGSSDEKAANEFRKLYQQLNRQKRDHAEKFEEQQNTFQSSIKRIVAETDQIKALLAVKMTDSRGFVGAAEYLLGQEEAARVSYESRQAKRERLMWKILRDQLLEMLMKAELDEEALIDVAAKFQTSLEDVFTNMENERARKENIKNHEQIIGPDIVAELTTGDMDEVEHETPFLRIIRNLHSNTKEYHEQLSDVVHEYQAKKTESESKRIDYSKAHQKMQRGVRVLSDAYRQSVERQMSTLDKLYTALVDTREFNEKFVEEAVTMMDDMKQEIEDSLEKGLFAGLTPELAEQIRIFLGKTYARIKPEDEPKITSEDVENKYNTLLDQFAGVDEDEKVDAITDHADDEVRKIDNSINQEVRGLFEGLTNQQELTADEIETQLEDLKIKQQVMESALAEVVSDRRHQADALIEPDMLTPEDAEKLHEAQESLNEMLDTHRSQVDDLKEQISTEEHHKLKLELETLRQLEAEARQELDALNQKFAEASKKAGSDGERLEVKEAHKKALHDQASKTHSLKRAVQENMNKIHKDARKELRDKTRMLRARQMGEAEAKRIAVRNLAKEVANNRIAQDLSGVDVSSIATLVDGKKSRDLKHQEEWHLKSQQELVAKQKKRIKEEKDKIAASESKKVAEMETQFQEQAKQKLEKLRLNLEHQVQGLDEEEAAVVRADNEAKIAEQLTEYESKKEQKKRELEKEFARERRRRLDALQRENDLEMVEELKEQKREKEALVKRNQMKKERKVLKKLLDEKNRKKGKKIIEAVTKARHKQEKRNLLENQFSEYSEKLNEKMHDVFEDLSTQRADVHARLDAKEITQEEADLELKELSDSVPAKKKAVEQLIKDSLEAKHNEEMDDLKKEQFENVKTLMQAAYPDEDFTSAEWQLESLDPAALAAEEARKQQEREDRMAAEMEEMKKKQIEEQRMLEELKAQKLAEWSAQWEEQMAAERKAKEQEVETLKQKMEEQEKKIEAEAKAKLDQQMAKLQAENEGKEGYDAEAEQERLMARFNEQREQRIAQQREEAQRRKEALMAKLEARKQMELQQKAQALDEDIAQREQEMEDKTRRQQEALLAEQKANEARIGGLVKQACLRLMAGAERRIEERESGVVLALRKLRANYQHKFTLLKPGEPGGPPAIQHTPAQLAAATAAQLAGKHVTYADGTLNVAATLAKVAPGGIGPKGEALATGTGMNTNGELSELHGFVQPGMPGMGAGVGGSGNISDPEFLHKLSKIENTLARMLKNDDGQFRAHLEPYQDPEDADLKLVGTHPVTIEPFELTPTLFILYRYGIFVLDYLCQTFNQPAVKLLIAKSLPEKKHWNLYAENIFKNSFHYDAATRTVFIRQERCKSVGDFTLILVHVLSHIRAGEWADTHPDFTKEFNASLRVLLGEVFFSRTTAIKAKRNEEGVPVRADTSGMSYNELRQVFGEADSLEFKEEVVNEFVDMKKIGSASDDFFARDTLHERLDKYKLYAHSANLQKYLNRVEDKVQENLRAHDKSVPLLPGTSKSELPDLGDTKGQSKQALIESKLSDAQDQQDRLHARLLEIAVEMQEDSDRLVQDAVEPGQVPTFEQRHLLAQHKARLKRNNIDKQCVIERLQVLDRRILLLKRGELEDKK